MARVLRRRMVRAPMAPADARCGGPPPPDGGNETAKRPPKGSYTLYRPFLRLLPSSPWQGHVQPMRG